MKLKHLTLLSLLGASCMVPNGTDGMVVVTKVIEATPSTGSSGSSSCTYDPTTEENTFGIFDPAAGYYHGLVLEDRLPDNSTLGPGRVNTNDFQVEYATIQYEVVSGPAQTLADQTVPGNSLIPTQGKGVTQVALVPPGYVADASTVRLHVQVHGRLLDGTKVKTNSYEYTVFTQAGYTVPAPTCSTGAPVYCENGGAQDTSVTCQ